MRTMRALIARHRALALGLVVATLALRVLVPPGFMPGTVDDVPTLVLCSGMTAVPLHTDPAEGARGGPSHDHLAHLIGWAAAGSHHHPGSHGGPDQPHPPAHKAEMPCAFAGLSTLGLAAADAAILVLALVFILATGFRATPFAIRVAPAFLRPPPIGPPANA